MIEDEFLPPCRKCLNVPGDGGPVCKLHYALLFLHYLDSALKDKRSYSHTSALGEAFEFPECDTDKAEPIGKQCVPTEELFKYVEEHWWKATNYDTEVLWYEKS